MYQNMFSAKQQKQFLFTVKVKGVEWFYLTSDMTHLSK